MDRDGELLEGDGTWADTKNNKTDGGKKENNRKCEVGSKRKHWKILNKGRKREER